MNDSATNSAAPPPLPESRAAAEGSAQGQPAPASSPQPQPNRPPAWLRWLLIVLVLMLGAAGTVAFVLSREEPQTRPTQAKGPLVEVITAQQQDVPVTVSGHGTVRARNVVQVVPQLSGQVVHVHPQVTAGGFFKAGETLIQIDRDDYKLALSQAKAQLTEAEAAVGVAAAKIDEDKARLKDAQLEADRLRELRDRSAVPQRELEKAELLVEQIDAQLVSARAQLDSAQAARQRAQVAIDQAQLNLDRTDLSMPFDGRVISESVDTGQYVRAGEPVAQVYGIQAVEVVVPLDDRQLRWLDVPLDPARAASLPRADCPPADITTTFAGRPHTWRGCVVRLESEIDPRSRMVRIVVEVLDPYKSGDDRPPLMPGAFVNVDIQGNRLEQVVPVPRYALHNGAELWVVTDGRLSVREVEVARSDREFAYVRRGVESGERVIVSQLDAVTEGMLVRTAEADPDAARPDAPDTEPEAPATADAK